MLHTQTNALKKVPRNEVDVQIKKGIKISIQKTINAPPKSELYFSSEYSIFVSSGNVHTEPLYIAKVTAQIIPVIVCIIPEAVAEARRFSFIIMCFATLALYTPAVHNPRNANNTPLAFAVSR